MNSKLLIKILWITILCSIILVIGSYVLNFKDTGISKDPSNWGHFADFLGGLLNPIFSVLNLLVLTYLTIKITKIEDERNQFTLQELARPLGEIISSREPGVLIISFKNCGLGPLKVRKISIKYEGRIYSSFSELFAQTQEMPANVRWSYWELVSEDEAILAKDSTADLIKYQMTKEDDVTHKYFSQLYNILYKSDLTIEYVDIYNRPMPQATIDFSKLSDKRH